MTSHAGDGTPGPAPDAAVYEPPAWVTGEWLKTCTLDAKQAARMAGEQHPLLNHWTSVDAIISWWESSGARDRAVGDSGGPREAVQEAAMQLQDWLDHHAKNPLPTFAVVAMRRMIAAVLGDSDGPREEAKAEAWNAAWDEAAWPPDGVPHPDKLVRFINTYNRTLRAELAWAR